MTILKDLEPGQHVTLPSGATGWVESVTSPWQCSELREVVLIDSSGDLVSVYLGHGWETVTAR